MARARLATSAEQIERLVEALTGAGWPVVNEFDPSGRPVNLDIATESGVRLLRVFCWNVTHGGARRAEDEYRVQTTRPGGVPLYLGQRLDLVLGYQRDLDVFAAWDAGLHINPGQSSSLQVQLDQLEEAARRGFVARPREVGHEGEVEVVVAFRPQAVRQYLESHSAFRVHGRRDDAEATATAADADSAIPVEELPGDVERQRVLSSVNRLARDARFRVRVLDAYGQRCAFCGLGARLTVAAHIRPVALQGLDQVRNGVAACPNHHAALDLGLILIEDDYALRVNTERLRRLGISGEDAGALAASLAARLRVPEAPEVRPALEEIRAHRAQWLSPNAVREAE